jgi:hypothetical protein
LNVKTIASDGSIPAKRRVIRQRADEAGALDIASREDVAMTSQIVKLTLLPGVDPAAFERKLREEILPEVEILRRNVAGTSHRLFRAASGPDASTYVWLVFTKLVGSTPETAGEGPVVLAETELPVAKFAPALAGLATLTVLDEIETG